MTYDKDSLPPMFFSPEAEPMTEAVRSYHDQNANDLGITSYPLGHAILISYYDSTGIFRISQQTPNGYTIPDVSDIQYLYQSSDFAI